MKPMDTLPRSPADDDPDPALRPAALSARRPVRVPRPAGWLRLESGRLSTDQALKNLETMVSLLQRALEGLNGIDQLHGDALVVVNDTWHKGDKSRGPPEGIAPHVRLRLGQMDEIVRQCRFHGRGLLDGQSGVVGVGLGVDFIRGGPNTRSSPPEGYAVSIDLLPTRAFILGGISLDEDWVREEKEIFLAEGEHFIRYRPGPKETATSLLAAIRTESRAAGLDLEIGMTGQQRLIVRHSQYGAQYKFKGCSALTPLLSKRPGKVEWSRRGRDIQGTLGGEPAFGIGRMLIGYLDSAHTSELAVVWNGAGLQGGSGGRCYVVQNGLSFQDNEGIGAMPVRIVLPSLYTHQLGRWMDTASGYDSLSDVRFGGWEELRDSLHLLLAVSLELDDWNERLQGWIKRYQNQALACLRKGHPYREAPRMDERVTAEQAERMARQLRSLMQRQVAAMG